MDESDDEGTDDAVLAVKRGVDGEAFRKHSVQEETVNVELRLNPQPQQKVAGAWRRKEEKVVQKVQRNPKINLAEHGPKYGFLP